jgi:hypothetical protein
LTCRLGRALLRHLRLHRLGGGADLDRARLGCLGHFVNHIDKACLAHAYAQCRSNRGAPGVDGQDFVAIEAYGLERWLAVVEAGTHHLNVRLKRRSKPQVISKILRNLIFKLHNAHTALRQQSAVLHKISYRWWVSRGLDQA